MAMLLVDVNPLVYALRSDSPDHRAWLGWLEACLNGTEHVGLCHLTLAAVVRIATNSRVFVEPTPLDEVLEFIDVVRSADVVVHLEPGPHHWTLMERLLRAVGATANQVSDVYLAALALEHDAEVMTADLGFRRYPGLRVRHPLRPV
ncbi:MAG: TA system VapC family ribonuclease toxin [Myxococcaceae bacterium]|nr:TA system VapC family ribonuclease toxin [Myxococcaceae bacterium]